MTSIAIPEELASALAADPVASELFNRMPPSHQSETVRYVAEAKRLETRVRRATQTILWLHEGKIGMPKSSTPRSRKQGTPESHPSTPPQS